MEIIVINLKSILSDFLKLFVLIKKMFPSQMISLILGLSFLIGIFILGADPTCSIDSIDYFEKVNNDQIVLLNNTIESFGLRLDKLNETLSEQSSKSTKSPPMYKCHANKSVDEICIKRYNSNCFEATKLSGNNGIYTIFLKSYNPINRQPILVYCEQNLHGSGWLVIQRRIDGSVDFYRDWNEYKYGFGSMTSEFFIGLEKLYELTTAYVHELLIVMENFQNDRRFARYNEFAIGDENQNYALVVLGKYTGNAGDSLRRQEGQKFTTKDRDNDMYHVNCAVAFNGAWWYKDCHNSNLNGVYFHGEYSRENFGKGIEWYTFCGSEYSLKSVQMMIRPKHQE